MRILFIGDIVGKPGRNAVKETLPGIKRELNIDFIIANGENAAGGNGITREIATELLTYGVNVLTMGNHVWDKKEIYTFIEKEHRILRPANYPPGTPGTGARVFKTGDSVKIGIINLSGRVFLSNLDCPFRSADLLLEKIRQETPVILVDFHAEATSEKIALGNYLDGRVSAVVGTHTHVQTADETILPQGTGYLTDVGMTGPGNGIIGVKKELVIEKFLTQQPVRFETAAGPYQFNAVVVEVDELTGTCRDIRRIMNFE